MSRKLENGFGETLSIGQEKVDRNEPTCPQFSKEKKKGMIDVESVQKDPDFWQFVKNFKLLLLLRYAKTGITISDIPYQYVQMFQQEPCILSSKKYSSLSWTILQDLLKNSPEFVFRPQDSKSKSDVSSRSSKLCLKTLHLSQQHANEIGRQVTFVQNLRMDKNNVEKDHKVNNHHVNNNVENNNHIDRHHHNFKVCDSNSKPGKVSSKSKSSTTKGVAKKTKDRHNHLSVPLSTLKVQIPPSEGFKISIQNSDHTAVKNSKPNTENSSQLAEPKVSQPLCQPEPYSIPSASEPDLTPQTQTESRLVLVAQSESNSTPTNVDSASSNQTKTTIISHTCATKSETKDATLDDKNKTVIPVPEPSSSVEDNTNSESTIDNFKQDTTTDTCLVVANGECEIGKEKFYPSSQLEPDSGLPDKSLEDTETEVTTTADDWPKRRHRLSLARSVLVNDAVEEEPEEVYEQIQVDISAGLKNLAMVPTKSNLKRRHVEDGSLKHNKAKRIKIVSDKKNTVTKVDAEGRMHVETIDEDEEEAVDPFECYDARMTKEIVAGEEVFWISPSIADLDVSDITVDYVRANMKAITINPRKKNQLQVDIGFEFVDKDTIDRLLVCKDLVASIKPWMYETWVRKLIAETESLTPMFKFAENAIKLANLDAITDFKLIGHLLCDNVTHDESCSLAPSSKFYYIDVWDRSRGFKEYIQWKAKLDESLPKFHGIGLQLPYQEKLKETVETLDIAVNLKNSDPSDYDSDSESEEDYVEYKSIDKDDSEGINLLSLDELDQFSAFVQHHTEGKGVHLLVADTEGIFRIFESVRETRYRFKFYSLCILALANLREGGTFVCKIYNSLSPFTVGLIWILHRSFQSIAIHIPTACMEGTTDRYIVCRGKLDGTETTSLLEHLKGCFELSMNGTQQRKIFKRSSRRKLFDVHNEVADILPPQAIRGYSEFFEFIRYMNIRDENIAAERFKKMCALLETKETEPDEFQKKLHELLEVRKERLKLWKIPVTKEKTCTMGADKCEPSSFLKKLVLPVAGDNGTYYEIF